MYNDFTVSFISRTILCGESSDSGNNNATSPACAFNVDRIIRSSSAVSSSSATYSTAASTLRCSHSSTSSGVNPSVGDDDGEDDDDAPSTSAV